MTTLPPIPPKLQGLGRSVVRWLEDAIRVITTADSTLGTHTALTTAHGSNGVIIGSNDTATTSTVGLVRMSAASANSAVVVTSADATAAGAAYSQAQAASVVALVNELKGDVNTLVADLNDLKTKMRAAGLLA